MEHLDFSKRFLPFERVVLAAIAELLNPEGQRLFADQIRHINKVQRLLEWREIEYYCMRWFKVRWPKETFFRDTGEFELGTVILRHGDDRAKVTVWSAGGHLFQLQSPNPMKPLRQARDIAVESAYAGHHQYKRAAI